MDRQGRREWGGVGGCITPNNFVPIDPVGKLLRIVRQVAQNRHSVNCLYSKKTYEYVGALFKAITLVLPYSKILLMHIVALYYA